MKSFLKKHGGILAACMASAAAVLWIHLRILTYVTAQDPFIYIGQARQLLAASFSPAELVKVFSWLMPGYPVLLALAIGLGGPFVPYWVNLPFTIGFFVLIAMLIRRLYADGLPLVVMTLYAVWVVLGGHGLNAHFLLYPFRESPMLFFCLLGFWLVLVAREKERAAWYALPGISFLLAGGIREPALLCVPFAALSIAVGIKPAVMGKPGARARALRWFLLPFLPAAGIWLLFSFLKGGWGTAQMSFWLYRLPAGGPDENIRHALHAVLPMLVLLRQAMGWGGLLLVVAGLLHAAFKRRDALFFFALPGFSLLLFYGCYKTHPRYLLESLVLLCPLAACGLYLPLAGASALAERFSRVRASTGLFASALLILVVLVSMTASRAQPWGLRVSRSDIRRFQEQMQPYEGTNNLVFMNARCRYFGDALISYTRVTEDDALQAARFREDPRRLYYADPSDPSCYYLGGTEYQGVSSESVVRHYFDVETPARTGSDSVSIELGANRFVMKPVRPWATTNTVQPLAPDSGHGRIVWLDFQSATQCAKKVTLLDDAWQTIRSWTIGPGVGLQPVYLPTAAGSFLRVEAECAMPSNVIWRIQNAGEPDLFDLAWQRNLSLMSWFKHPFAKAEANRKYGVGLVERGCLEIPGIPGAEQAALGITLGFQPGMRQNALVSLFYQEGGQELGRDNVDLSRPLIHHQFRIPPQAGGGPHSVAISANQTMPEGNYLRVMGFGLHIWAPDEGTTRAGQ